MKRHLALAVVGTLTFGLPVAAHADGAGYTGTCRIATVNDGALDGTLGGQRVWNGEVNILVAASTPGSLITTAGCYVRVNLSGSEAEVLSAVTGGPVAAAAGQVTLTADITDTVYVCTHVATSTSAETDDCAALTTTPICPVQVCGPGGVVDQVVAIGGSLNCAVNTGNCNSGHCTVNTGTCNAGYCFVNMGTCDEGGACTVNGPGAYCGPWARCPVNLGSCTSDVFYMVAAIETY